MSLTSRSIATEVEQFLSYLQESDLALLTTVVKQTDTGVSWHSFHAIEWPLETHTTALDYRTWVEAGAYSAFMFDGSLIQISYDLDGAEIDHHRLCFVPAPYDFDPDLLAEGDLIEVFDLYAGGERSNPRLVSPIRFDLDLRAAKPGHPASHFTVNSADCRLGCSGPMRLGRFVQFIFQHFYPAQWDVHPYLRDMPRKGWGGHTLSDLEREDMHILWAA